MSDTFMASAGFRVLAVIEGCIRKRLALIADTSLSGAREARELAALIRIYGKPDCLFSDTGSECTSWAVFKWAGGTGVEGHSIDPGHAAAEQSGRKLQRQLAR